MLGSLQPVALPAFLAALGLAVLASFLVVRLQPVQDGLRAEDAGWASTLRDLLNVVVLLLLVAVLALAGLPWPAALLWGGTAFLVAETLRHFVTTPRTRALSLGVVVAALLLVGVVAPRASLSLMERAAAFFS